MSFESRCGGRGQHRARVAASASDYAQPRCQKCGKRISDDRLENHTTDNPRYGKYCSSVCATVAGQIRRGHGTGRGPQGRWRGEYDRAMAANGAWVFVHCSDKTTAESLTQATNNKNGFEAVRNGLDVSIRKSVIA